MNNTGFNRYIASIEQIPFFKYFIKWLLITSIVGILCGTASAIFLLLLDWVINLREANIWLIALLPFGGLLIGLLYHYYGTDVVKGNSQLLEELHTPKQIIPLKMAPMVLVGTLITHLFGGSAGREGTAVQMGGAIADQFTKLFRLTPQDRKILITIGISAGFASVFGTPLAGAVFALEVLIIGRIRYEAILPSLFAAVIADYVCHSWGVGHVHYIIPDNAVPVMSPLNFFYAAVAGVVFGVVAMIFSKVTHFWGRAFKVSVAYPPLRPVIGGIFIVATVWLLGTTKYIGLGIPVISDAFTENLNAYDFIVKLLLTSFTLGAGFKGGEVTPLFFIGATLGNVLIWFLPLPMPLLAGMGFVAVFSGATNTPIACTLMGIELFGAEGAVYIAIACIMAYLFSGHTGIYSSQIIGSPKHLIYARYKSKYLNNITDKE